MQWFTPIRGIFHSKDKVLATNAQTFNGGPMPGPLVYAINAKFLLYLHISCLDNNFASFKAYLINGRICLAWCSAVYLGKNPVPGGVTNVFLGFDKIFP